MKSARNDSVNQHCTTSRDLRARSCLLYFL